MKLICVCGHAKDEHWVSSGPNSNGEHQFGLCGHMVERDGSYYVIRHCMCYGFHFSFRNTLRRYLEKKP